MAISAAPRVMPAIREGTLLTPPLVEEGDKDYEEVTETRIIGITETGVIRKRSFKRKIRKEEKASSISYGQNLEEYNKIRDRVLSTKMALESVAGLKQRFRMIEMMHEDCMELVTAWKETRERRIKKQQGHKTEGMVLAYGVGISVLWLLIYLILW